MPSYTVSEFADITGKRPENIHLYIKRGKLVSRIDVVNGRKTKMLDESDPLNSAFIEKNRNPEEKQKKEPQKKVEPKEIQHPTSKEATEEQKKIDFQIPTSADLLKVDYEKKLKEVQKLKKEIAIKDEDLKKKRKEVIDTESTIALVKAFSDSLKKELVSRIQTQIQDICTRYSIDPARAAKYVSNVVEIVNKSNDVSRDMLLKHFMDE